MKKEETRAFLKHRIYGYDEKKKILSSLKFFVSIHLKNHALVWVTDKYEILKCFKAL